MFARGTVLVKDITGVDVGFKSGAKVGMQGALVRGKLSFGYIQLLQQRLVFSLTIGGDEGILDQIVHTILLLDKVADLVENIQERGGSVPRRDSQHRALGQFLGRAVTGKGLGAPAR